MLLSYHANRVLLVQKFSCPIATHGVGYHEKGYPKQEPKNDCLDSVKDRNQLNTAGLGQFSDSPEAPSPLTSGDPPPKASADPLSSQASAGPPILRLARGGHGSTPLPLPPPVPLTKRRVTLTQPTAAPDISRMLGTVQQND